MNKKITLFLCCMVMQNISPFSFQGIKSFFGAHDTFFNVQRAQFYTGTVAFWIGGYAMQNDKCLNIGASLMAGPFVAAGLGALWEKRFYTNSTKRETVSNIVWTVTVPVSIFAINKFYRKC